MSNIQFSQTLHNLNLQNDASTGDHAVRLSQLQTRENQLQSALQTYADDKITDLVDGAPGTLDTLNEIAAALADDNNLATTLSGNITDLRTSLEAADGLIRSEFAAADNLLRAELNGNISTASGFLTQADATLQSNISAEAGLRQTADTTLQDNIDAEAGLREEAVTRLEGDIAQKINSADGVATGVLKTDDVAVSNTSYVYIGDKWRIKAEADGSQLNFEYAPNGTGALNTSLADWRIAIPFITTTELLPI